MRGTPHDQQPQQLHQRADQEHHVQARHREHVGEPRAAHGLIVAIADRVALAEHQRERDARGTGRQRRLQAPQHVQPRALEPGARALRIDHLDRARVVHPYARGDRVTRRPRRMRRRIAEARPRAELADQAHARAGEQRHRPDAHHHVRLDRAPILDALAAYHARDRARAAIRCAMRLEHLELKACSARCRRLGHLHSRERRARTPTRDDDRRCSREGAGAREAQRASLARKPPSIARRERHRPE
jgi:hypothetical protein